MDTKQDMAGIIERLEAASGPDRGLDLMIYEAAFGSYPHPHGTGSSSIFTWPNFSSSIDAALSLVPEGWRWKLGYSKHVPCVAELVDYTPKAIGATCGECDSNHAIALCIAALRARANKGEG